MVETGGKRIMVNKRREENKEFSVTIGPLLKDILEKQKRKVSEATYECVRPSDYEVGEIIAKKVIASKTL